MTNGEKTLKELKKILDELECTFWLSAGTLLFAIRENKLSEDDIDLGMRDCCYQILMDNLDKIKEAGFGISQEYSHPSGLGREITLEKNGTKIDIFETHYRDGFAWWMSYAPWAGVPHIVYKVPVLFLHELMGITFLDEEWLIPNYPAQYLILCYGKWWVPEKNWKYYEDPLCIDQEWEIK